MGRWGHFLLEGDQDCDIFGEIEQDIRGIIGGEWLEKSNDDKIMPRDLVKTNLNTGTAKQLMEKYRTQNEYYNIILAAFMMRIGATLDDETRSYLRELVPKIPSRYGYHWPLSDDGFREPGKVQFLAALTSYENGKERDLSPSCWTCGKTKAELGRVPATCKRCEQAHYCDRDCQKADWAKHKKMCKPRGILLNV